MSPDTLPVLLESWKFSLRAQRRSPRTIDVYMLAGDQLVAFLDDHGYPNTPSELTRRHIEEFIVSILDDGRSPATAKQRFASLRNFFNWLTTEEVIERSPMANMKPPSVEEKPPPVLSEEELAAVLATTKGTDFRQRRDHAILRCLIDTGARISEISDLSVDALDLDHQIIRVVGKGDRIRDVPIGHKTVLALDRYLAARRRHRLAGLPDLWLGKRGPVTRSGMAQIIRSRGREAGIDGLHAHLFRHTFAHRWLAAGGREHDLINVAGWSDTQMLARYGASAASERAREAHDRLGLGDKL